MNANPKVGDDDIAIDLIDSETLLRHRLSGHKEVLGSSMARHFAIFLTLAAYLCPANGRRCSAIDSEVQLANGTFYPSSHAKYGEVCWDPITWPDIFYVNETKGCDPLVGDELAGANGTIVLIERGGCAFAQKSKNAQDAGSIAVLMYNDLRTMPSLIIDNGACIGGGACSAACANECPGLGVSVTIPTLLVAREVGLVLVETPQAVSWDCPITPEEAQCGSLAPSTSPTMSPTMSPSSRAPTVLGETFSPTVSPVTPSPTFLPTPSPTMLPTIYRGPTLVLAVVTDFNISGLTDLQIAELEDSITSSLEQAVISANITELAGATFRVEFRVEDGTLTTAILDIPTVDLTTIEQLAEEVNGTSASLASLGGGGGFAVASAVAVPAPTASPTSSPSVFILPAPSDSEGFWTETVIIGFAVAGTVVLLIVMNCVCYFIYRDRDSDSADKMPYNHSPQNSRARQPPAYNPAPAWDSERWDNPPPSSTHHQHYYPDNSSYSVENSAFNPVDRYDHERDYTYKDSKAHSKGQRTRYDRDSAQPNRIQNRPLPSAPPPHKWYPTGAVGNQKSPKGRNNARPQRKYQEPGSSVLAQVGAQPWHIPAGQHY